MKISGETIERLQSINGLESSIAELLHCDVEDLNVSEDRTERLIAEADLDHEERGRLLGLVAELARARSPHSLQVAHLQVTGCPGGCQTAAWASACSRSQARNPEIIRNVISIA